MVGRKTKLTDEVQKRFVDAIRAGNYYETACHYAGIDYSTFRRWMQKGEEQKSGAFREFCEAVKKAEAESEMRMVTLWQKQAVDNWQAARDFLERRFPDRWGRRDRLAAELSGPAGGPVEVDVHQTLMNRIDSIAQKRAMGSMK
jgi:hypothetical protein